MARTAAGVTATLAALPLGLGALVFFGQRRLAFPAPDRRVPAPSWFEIVALPGGSFYLWSDAGEGPVVVHFHGNGHQVSDTALLAQQWRRLGVSFASVEYPGYPGAGGHPSEKSVVATGLEAVTHLIEASGISRERLVLFGESMGTGVAVALAARGYGTKLVLLSPFTSLPDVADVWFRRLPVRSLVRDRFDSLATAGAVHQSTLVVHGTADEVVPFALGERLARALPDGRLLAVEGAGHSDLWGHEEAQVVFDFVTGQPSSRGTGLRRQPV